MPLYRFSLHLLALFVPTAALAQKAEPLDLSGTIRLRYETIANQPRTGFDRNDDLINLRTTLLAKYDTGPIVLAAELWDSRVYAADAGTPVTTGDVNAFELVQAYAAGDISLGGSGKVTLQAGRFTLNIGSRRLVAADDYRNTTNGYTGLHADIASHGVTATVVYVLPQQRRPDDPAALRDNAVGFDHEGFDLVLWGGTATKAKAIGPVAIEGSFYHLGERDVPGRPTRNRSLNTYGGRLLRDPAKGNFDVEAEAFYQSGHIMVSTLPTAAGQSVSAWFVHADAGYTFTAGWQPRLSVEYDRASGDRADGSYGRFDTLFGMRRADLAPAGLYNAIGRANISTPGARIEVVPSKWIDAFASYHALWLAGRKDAFSTTGVRDASGASGAFAGNQLDARLRWWVRPASLRLEADGVILTKGQFLRDAPNAPSGGTTFYGSLNLTRHSDRLATGVFRGQKQRMLYLALKAIVSGVLIAAASTIAKRYPGFGALIASLPLVSVLGMIWLWSEKPDAENMAAHAGATFWYVLPSLPMFVLIPILLRHGMTFWLALALGCVLTVLLYLLMTWIAPRFGLQL